jgi:hypothetical protein
MRDSLVFCGYRSTTASATSFGGASSSPTSKMRDLAVPYRSTVKQALQTSGVLGTTFVSGRKWRVATQDMPLDGVLFAPLGSELARTLADKEESDNLTFTEEEWNRFRNKLLKNPKVDRQLRIKPPDNAEYLELLPNRYVARRDGTYYVPVDDSMNAAYSWLLRKNYLQTSDYLGIPGHPSFTKASYLLRRNGDSSLFYEQPIPDDLLEEWINDFSVFDTLESYKETTPDASCIVFHWANLSGISLDKGKQLYTRSAIWAHTSSEWWYWREGKTKCVLIRIPPKTQFEFGTQAHDFVTKGWRVYSNATTVILPPSIFEVVAEHDLFVLVDLKQVVGRKEETFSQRLASMKKYDKPEVLEGINFEKLYVALEHEWGEGWTLDETHGAKLLFSNLFKFFELRQRSDFWNWERMQAHGIVKAITPYVCIFYLEYVLQSYTDKFNKDFMKSVFDHYRNEYDKLNVFSDIRLVFSKDETWDILVKNDLVSSLNMFIATKILLSIMSSPEVFKKKRTILLDSYVHLDWYFILHYLDDVDERARSMYDFHSYSYVKGKGIGHDLWRLRKPTAEEMKKYVLPTDEGMRRLSFYISLDRQGWFTFLNENNFLERLTEEQQVELIHDDVNRLQAFVDKKVIALPTVLESMELGHKVEEFAHLFKVLGDTEGTPEQKISLLNHRKPDEEEVKFILRNEEYLKLVPIIGGGEWWMDEDYSELVRKCKAIVKTAVADKQEKINYLIPRGRFVFDTFNVDELNSTFGEQVVESARKILRARKILG